MANKRIYYACQRAGIAPTHASSVSFTTIRGLQSIGVTTTFNLEQLFEMGQLAIYENIEGIPDVEVTTEKVLDGYCPVYLLATAESIEGTAAPNATLAGRSPGYCILGIAIYDETVTQAQGNSGTEVHMSGMYVSSIRYQVSTDGNATESLTMVGNNKVWVVGGATGSFVGHYVGSGTWDVPWGAAATLQPKAIGGSGGVNRREDVLFGNGATKSFLPTCIPGITNYSAAGVVGSGQNILGADGNYGAHIQSISISSNFGREQLFELGRRGTFYRYINWPVEVSSEITVIATSGDMISATEDGIYEDAAWKGKSVCGSRYNLINEKIVLRLCEGLMVDAGENNKLQSVGATGANTGKGNLEITYSFRNFNEMTVKHPSDPVVALQP